MSWSRSQTAGGLHRMWAVSIGLVPFGKAVRLQVIMAAACLSARSAYAKAINGEISRPAYSYSTDMDGLSVKPIRIFF